MPRINLAGETVTCCKCKRSYVCMPNDDYYNATSPTDGLCEPCLLESGGLGGAPLVEVTLDDYPWVRCKECQREFRSVAVCKTHQLCNICHPEELS